MKTYKLTLLAIAAMGIFSCSKDDSSSSTNDSNLVDSITEDAAEEVYLNIDSVEEGLLISGATKIEGSLSPNEQTSFSIDDTTLSGLQEVGTTMSINVPDDFAGTYIQLVDEDGTPSDNYFDVPSYNYFYRGETNNSHNLFGQRSSNLTSRTVSARSTEDDTTETITIGFDETISAGTFCYLVCIYDVDGNISAPTEVCVEVESWGGTDLFNGSWSFDKYVIEYDGEVETYENNQVDSYTERITCYYDESIFTDFEYVENEGNLVLTFNNDGTHNYTNDYSYNYGYYDFDCEFISSNYEYENSANGGWAFNEEEDILTLVDFSYSSIEYVNGEEGYSYTEDSYDIGFQFEVIELTENKLIMEYVPDEVYDDYYDDEAITYYFTK